MNKTPEDFKDENGFWTCIKCGACCEAAGLIITSWDRGDGACESLLRDNTCEIYADRPEVCRVNNFRVTSDTLTVACALLYNQSRRK